MTDLKRTTTICFILIIGVLPFLSSCKTYFIPIEIFKQQFANLDSSQFKEVETRGPIGDKVKYKTYPMDFISCVDNKGQSFHLQMSPSIEIRFTDTNNKKTVMYLDLMRVNDEYVSGSESRIISSVRRTIPLKTIKKIEIQDGKV
jgi:hypothetical protein